MNRSHPLRRPSTGSLSSLARSTDRNATSPSGLDFLQPALAELNDEASTLAANISHLTELHDALGTFNESFAGYLYALRMNAFCVEWMQAPDENSFARLTNLEKQLADAQKAAQAAEQQQLQLQQQAAQQAASAATPAPQPSAADMTYATAYSSVEESQPPARGKASLGGAAKKPAAAATNTVASRKQALANKKKRELEISQILNTLPLEYRGSQPDLHMAMEKVISSLMDAPDGLPLKALVTPPLVPQTRANKCTIALVAKKLVVKNNVGGTAFYTWVG